MGLMEGLWTLYKSMQMRGGMMCPQILSPVKMPWSYGIRHLTAQL